MKVGGQLHDPSALLLVRQPGGPPGSVWTGAENLTPTGIRFPDLPARSESLYRLRHIIT